jgi:hypothetical protein
MIEYVLNVAAISLLTYNIRESVRNSSSIILQSLVLTIFITENTCSIVAVEIEKVSKNTITRKTSWQIVDFLVLTNYWHNLEIFDNLWKLAC